MDTYRIHWVQPRLYLLNISQQVARKTFAKLLQQLNIDEDDLNQLQRNP